jgi:transcriptional antiterminator RfaH
MQSISSKKNTLERNWLVIYTRPNWEKKVHQLLLIAGIESYCPVRMEEHIWADRKKMVSVPVFNSYVFVKINRYEESVVRQTLGVINFIYYLGRPAVVRNSEIEAIQRFLNDYPDLEIITVKELSPGERVKIRNGPFMNQHGDILQIRGKNVLLKLENLESVLVTKVTVKNIELA